ncbi:flagellar FlbD family protein [Tepidibacter aestuarii]|uniref:flagellar FlbD family protein n=1 Tax=Tepidibacter aestuarii TaxID=2925782 RepID=UPI0020BDAA43|nr:flagellar FlbD family protein [Tepidibacter aestuarii]CAH2214018.1 flagellar power transducer required for swarming [Tepidibacter aestuarii]
MIKVKRLNNEEFVINCDLIETLENTPDTVITLTNGNKYIVKEDVNTIIQKVKAFKKDIIKIVDGRKGV